jgi:hypothetical protein
MLQLKSEKFFKVATKEAYGITPMINAFKLI